MTRKKKNLFTIFAFPYPNSIFIYFLCVTIRTQSSSSGATSEVNYPVQLYYIVNIPWRNWIYNKIKKESGAFASFATCLSDCLCDLNIYKESTPVTSVYAHSKFCIFISYRVLCTGWLSISDVALVRFMRSLKDNIWWDGGTWELRSDNTKTNLKIYWEDTVLTQCDIKHFLCYEIATIGRVVGRYLYTW